MTIKELLEILNKVEDKNMKVCINSYYSDSNLNGYYLETRGGEDTLILTSLKVQPRV
jgi:hypothetical protein